MVIIRCGKIAKINRDPINSIEIFLVTCHTDITISAITYHKIKQSTVIIFKTRAKITWNNIANSYIDSFQIIK